jgi:antagonist of KipI
MKKVNIDVLQSGWQTTLQDGGRPGLRCYGIPQAGAMDKASFRWANLLAGNPPEFPVLEALFKGGILRFDEGVRIGVAGPGAAAYVNKRPIDISLPVFLSPGDTLRFESRRKGVYVYLAIQGEPELPKWLDSYSTYLPAKKGGFQGRSLEKGDRLIWKKIQPATVLAHLSDKAHFHPDFVAQPSLRFLPGPEWPWLGPVAQDVFQSYPFVISPQSDRMGIRLEGRLRLSLECPEILSSATVPGTIQWPPGGKPIVLVNDGQTTGGYPRVGKVLEADLDQLVQQRPGLIVRFTRVSLDTIV